MNNKILNHPWQSDTFGVKGSNMDIEKTLQRYEKAFRKLGIAFCPICEEPHNTRSNLHADLDGYIHFSLTNEESVYVCPGCALAWAKRRKRLISNHKFGFALASWILEQRVYEATHPHHEHAVELSEAYDIRFDLLLWRRAKAAGMVLHGRTEERLLASLGYTWNLKARQINTHVLDYIDFVRGGGKVEDDAWPPKFEKEAA